MKNYKLFLKKLSDPFSIFRILSIQPKFINKAMTPSNKEKKWTLHLIQNAISVVTST